jgi:hypothetical protein
MKKIYCNEYDIVYSEDDFRIFVYKSDLKNYSKEFDKSNHNATFDVDKIIYDEFTNPVDKKKLSFQLVILGLDKKMLDFIKAKQSTFIGVLDKESIYNVLEAQYVA